MTSRRVNVSCFVTALHLLSYHPVCMCGIHMTENSIHKYRGNAR